MGNIQKWLFPPDPWKNFNIARKSRHSETGAWFVKSETLSEWKDSGPSSLLWINGKRPLSPVLTFSQRLIPSSVRSGLWEERPLVC